MSLQEQINEMWSKSVDSFITARKNDLNSEDRVRWTEVFRKNLPKKETVRALDLGTGVGYFAYLLNDLGCDVTAVDYSADMIRGAEEFSKALGYSGIRFLQMDAQNLEFPDESFDLIVTRNVTWTLPDAEAAYREMCRVLAPGGRILNCDANYGGAYRKIFEDGVEEDVVRRTGGSTEKKLETFRSRELVTGLPVSSADRPSWDLCMLLKYGCAKVSADARFEDTIPFPYNVVKNEDGTAKNGASIQSYRAPVFLVTGEK